MTLFERITSWITGRPRPIIDTASTESGQAAQNKILELTTSTTNTNTTKIMVNTITLSSDMEKLFLIDDGRVIEFKISEDKGILVGTLNGQITVATALRPPQEVDMPLETGEDDTPQPVAPGAEGARVKPGMPVGEKVEVSTKNSQYTVFFNRGNTVMGLIGIGEIDTSIISPERINPEVFFFSLTNNVVDIRRKDGKITFQLIRRF
ncbi:MAG: hypothetical protein AAF798_11045 [Bacteroidota bacterium]